MKRIALVIAVAMVFAATVPALAGPALSTSGSVDTRLRYEPGSGLTSESEVKFGVGLSSEAGDEKARLHMEFAPINLSAQDSFGNLTPFGGNVSLVLDRVYLQTTGALYRGGQDVTLTLGDMDVVYSPWVAEVMDVEGVKVDGIRFGDTEIRGFHIWDGSDKVIGANTDVSIAGVDLSGSIVKRLSDDNLAYSGVARLNPFDNVSVEGLLAVDAANNARAIKVDTTVGTFDNYTIKGGYRSIDSAFGPAYQSAHSGSDPVKHAGQTGYNLEVGTTIDSFDITGILDRYDKDADQMRTLGVRVGTEVQGTTIGVDHDITTDLVANTSSTATKVTAQRDFALAGNTVAGKYTYSSTAAMQHSIEASTKLDIAVLEDVALAAKVETDGSIGNLNYNVRADYGAPNGMTFGAEYDGNAGFAATAGLRVSF